MGMPAEENNFGCTSKCKLNNYIPAILQICVDDYIYGVLGTRVNIKDREDKLN